MCYNYANLVPGSQIGDLVDKYELRVSERRERWEQFKERFNFFYTTGFSHQELPVITMQKPDELQFFRWGLIPHWVKASAEADILRKQTLNAKSETVFTLPSFRSYIKSRRCLIPSTGFFDWREYDKKKYPYHILVRDEDSKNSIRPFCFGGIYSQWVDKEGGETIDTFSIITTPANKLMEIIHNTKKRMPLIIQKSDEDRWLDSKLDEAQIKELMKPYPDPLMVAHTITKHITAQKVERNVAEVIEPQQYEGVENWLKGDSLPEKYL
jgi:putative SOS response-associated peptidase YedK